MLGGVEARSLIRAMEISSFDGDTTGLFLRLATYGVEAWMHFFNRNVLSSLGMTH